MREEELQFEYIEKLKNYVSNLKKELGHQPTCCVTTFGCPIV